MLILQLLHLYVATPPSTLMPPPVEKLKAKILFFNRYNHTVTPSVSHCHFGLLTGHSSAMVSLWRNEVTSPIERTPCLSWGTMPPVLPTHSAASTLVCLLSCSIPDVYHYDLLTKTSSKLSLGRKENKPLNYLLNRTLSLLAPPVFGLWTLIVQPFKNRKQFADQNVNSHMC